MTELTPGDRVGRYVVEARLGGGGAASVYRVRHVDLGVVRALKVIRDDDPDSRERLLREGRLQAGLDHPHVVRVFDVLDVAGAPALVMAFHGGGTLAERVAGRALPPADAERWFVQVMEGVAALHAIGVVHRDVKPQNVLIDDAGAARVADLGIAKEIEADPSERRTRGGMGTPAYVAPEQIWHAATVDERADVWALGALLFELLAGEPPFGDGGAILRGEAVEVPRLPEGTPETLRAVVDAALVPDPSRRARDIATLRDLLREARPAADTITVEPVARRSAPAPAPASGPGATAIALVVDGAGVGHGVEVVVQLVQDGAGVSCGTRVARDAEVAAQVAAAAALQGMAEVGVRWFIRGTDTGLVHGTSIGLAVAVATRAAALGRPVPAGQAFTGGVDLDGRVVAVRSIRAKLDAARRDGARRAWIPSDAEAPADPLIARADHLDDVFRALGLRQRGRRLRWAALALAPLIAFSGASSPLDALVHGPLLRMADGSVPIDDAVVVAIEPQIDRRSLRPQHAAVLDGLVAAGATAIVFDLALSAPSPHDDDIAAAIGRARGASVPVILPVRMVNGAALEPASAAIREVAVLATVELHAGVDIGQVRRAPARRTSADGRTWWHAAAWAAAAHLHATDPPRLDGAVLVTGPARNRAARDGTVALRPTDPPPRAAYDDPATWSAARGKVALIGQVGGTEDILRTADGPRHGVEVLAGLFQILVRQAAPRMLAPELDALLALLTGLATAALAHGLRPAVRMAALAVPLLALLVTAALAVGGTLTAVVPLVLAGAAGVWVARK